jgi:hypothetical protein
MASCRIPFSRWIVPKGTRTPTGFPTTPLQIAGCLHGVCSPCGFSLQAPRHAFHPDHQRSDKLRIVVESFPEPSASACYAAPV